MWPNALAHLLPIEHGAAGDAALTLGLLALGVFASTLVGVIVGNETTCRLPRGFLTAVSSGMLLFLLFDLFKESAGLGQGILANPLLLVGLLAAFAAGILLVPTIARNDTWSWLAWAWIGGIALHGMGEGYVLGTEAKSADISGVAGIASFLLHKGMEAFTVPILIGAGLGKKLTPLAALALAATTLLAAIAGTSLGSSTLPLFLFAAGAGAAAHVMLRLARDVPTDAKHAAYVLLGVLLVYGAGLLHEA